MYFLSFSFLSNHAKESQREMVSSLWESLDEYNFWYFMILRDSILHQVKLMGVWWNIMHHWLIWCRLRTYSQHSLFVASSPSFVPFLFLRTSKISHLPLILFSNFGVWCWYFHFFQLSGYRPWPWRSQWALLLFETVKAQIKNSYYRGRL